MTFRAGAKRLRRRTGVGSVAIPRGATRIADGGARDAYGNTSPARSRCDEHEPARRPRIEVTPERARELLESGEALVVDVREPYEREAGHIEGTRHIELERLASNAETLPRDRPIVFHCRLGARSALAARAFRSAGYDAWSLRGGHPGVARPGPPHTGEVADH